MSLRPAANSIAKQKTSSEWLAAVVLSAGVMALHVYFLTHIGGLWQDEVNSVNLAQGRLSQMSHDSFPILMPVLLRGWSALGLGGSDLNLRAFGVLAGLALTGAFWLAAWWTRRVPPLWSLVLAALNAWVIYYGASLRAYGLGSALIVVCAAAAWVFLERPTMKGWLLFAGAVVVSVQTLYQNSVLVLAICAGAWAVCWRRKSIRLAVGVWLAGLAGAVSLLPYWTNLFGMSTAAAPMRLDFDRVTAMTDLNTLLAFPLPQYFWIWLLLAAVVIVCGGVNFFFAGKDDLAVFSAVTLLSGTAFFFFFLKLANFPVQPWYFLPLLALAAMCLETALPRLGGRYRSVLWGGLAATAMISCLFAVRILDYRFTNIDSLAKKVTALSRKNDFVIVSPWHGGVTFGRYFKGPCEWTTVPPIADHSCHRYDLVKLQMENTNAMSPVLERMGDTLRTGGAVWIVGGVGGEDTSPTEPPSPPLPPLLRTGWQETPYGFVWNSQMTWFLHHHSREIECIDPAPMPT